MWRQVRRNRMALEPEFKAEGEVSECTNTISTRDASWRGSSSAYTATRTASPLALVPVEIRLITTETTPGSFVLETDKRSAARKSHFLTRSYSALPVL